MPSSKKPAKAAKRPLKGKRKPPPPTPTKRTPAIVAEILARISKGEPLAEILRSDPKFPHQTTWDDWVSSDPALAIARGRARDAGHDAIAADALKIADDDTRDWEPVKDADGNIVGVKVDGEHVTRSKLRIETRLKLLAKWDPRRYGERLDLTHANPDGGPVQFEKIERVIIDPKK